jgi:hypothetical protein
MPKRRTNMEHEVSRPCLASEYVENISSAALCVHLNGTDGIPRSYDARERRSLLQHGYDGATTAGVNSYRLWWVCVAIIVSAWQ